MTTKNETTSPEVIRAAIMNARHLLVATLSHMLGMHAFLKAVVMLEYISAASLPAWREAISGVLFALRANEPIGSRHKGDKAWVAAKEVERLLDVLLTAFMRERWPEDAPTIPVDRPSREPYQETTDRGRGDR